MSPRGRMPTSSFWRSTWCLIGWNRFVDREPRNNILPSDMNKNIKWTLRMVGTPLNTISTTCYKDSSVGVIFSASKSESSICKPSLSVGRTALQPAQSSFLMLIRLPPWAPSHVQDLKLWDLTTTVKEGILTRWSKTSEYYSIIHNTQHTAWQYSSAHSSLSSIRIVTWRMDQINNCTQWGSVFTMFLSFKLRVKQVNAYLGCVDAQEARAAAAGIDGTTGNG